jgi:hypothetical protein
MFIELKGRSQGYTLLELLYFVFATLGAMLAAQSVYRHEGCIWAAIVFAIVLGVFVWFFFSGLFYRLMGFIFRLKH